MKSVLSWSDVCRDPSLRDLPVKIEINARGILEMGPAGPKHGEFQSEVSQLLRTFLKDGRVITECPIVVAEGVRVPDVVWNEFPACPVRRKITVHR